MKERSIRSSYAMMIGSMLIFGTIGIFRRFIPLSSASLALARGVIGGLFLILLVSLGRKKLDRSIPAAKKLGLVLSGIMIGFNWVLLFEAYNYTTVARATLCYYMQPTIVILLSPLFFKEKLGLKKLICAAAAVLGMVLISGVLEDAGGGNAKGVIFGLGAAVLYAMVIITNKKIGAVDAYYKTIVQLLSAAAVMIPYMIITRDQVADAMNLKAVILVLVVGLIHTGIAYAMYFASMEKLKAQSIAILSYIDPVAALFLSALILHEPMTGLGIAGAVLILGAAIVGG